MIQILVTGSKGQLGSELQVLSNKYSDYKYFFTDAEELDITKPNDLNLFFKNNSIDYIINCAAYTAVDKAETEKELSDMLNHQSIGFLLEASQKNNTKLIQISTDYVFGGQHNTPLKEELATEPESAYGLSKLRGEKRALNSDRALIIRTSWLYSSFGHNFVKTIQKIAKEKETISVVYDQIGTPTYAKDLAKSIINIIQSSEENAEFKKGIYHFANEGAVSWYDFAHAICTISEIKVEIKPVLSEAFPTLAKRPVYSVLDKSKIKNTFGIKIPYWKESLANCIAVINKNRT